MSKFKVGDKVKVVKDFRTWLSSASGRSADSQAFTVIDTKEDPPAGREWINHKTKEIELYAVTKYPEDFKIHIFDIGDKIICNRPEECNWYKKGDILTVSGEPFVGSHGEWCVHVDEQDSNHVWVSCCQFDKVITALSTLITRVTTLDDIITAPSTEPHLSVITSSIVEANKLGIYRPDIETRKADKIRMELFDDGFPNAILEVAKIMTWAQKAKGYKDHDWKNLPNPENTLKGAGSRHRRDANSQKAEGVPPAERLDHESKLHHLGHQAFNILAELELILTGKIV